MVSWGKYIVCNCNLCKSKRAEELEKAHMEKIHTLESQATPKPCPACGRTDVTYERGSFDQIRCSGCDTSGPMFDGHPMDALAAWNALPRLPAGFRSAQPRREDTYEGELLCIIADIRERLTDMRQIVDTTPAPCAAEPRTLNIATACPHCRREFDELVELDHDLMNVTNGKGKHI